MLFDFNKIIPVLLMVNFEFFPFTGNKVKFWNGFDVIDNFESFERTSFSPSVKDLVDTFMTILSRNYLFLC